MKPIQKDKSTLFKSIEYTVITVIVILSLMKIFSYISTHEAKPEKALQETNQTISQEIEKNKTQTQTKKELEKTNNLQKCLESATDLRQQWDGIGQLAGRIVIHSAEIEAHQFAGIKDELQEFFNWFEGLLRESVVDFKKSNPSFDFVKASSKSSNDFETWLGKDGSDTIKHIAASIISLSYWANDQFEFKGNPVKPIIDSSLKTIIREDLSMRTIIEALKLKFTDGD
jgi:hypothetical protein